MAQAAMIMQLIGTAMEAHGELAEGEAAWQAARMTERQLKQNANQTEAEGLRKGAEYRRMGDVMQGDARAAMAAGGGVTDDVGAITQLADIENVFDNNAMAAIYESRNRAQQQRYAGDVARAEGKFAKKSSRLKALSTVFSGGSKAAGMS